MVATPAVSFGTKPANATGDSGAQPMMTARTNAVALLICTLMTRSAWPTHVSALRVGLRAVAAQMPTRADSARRGASLPPRWWPQRITQLADRQVAQRWPVLGTIPLVSAAIVAIAISAPNVAAISGVAPLQLHRSFQVAADRGTYASCCVVRIA